ncbi:PH domain-containing protein [Candidatus Nanohalovita haloferacivicina]|uniref:PH domain-containing protein n=1 Tax=Candidatus Nanohalovita haloferacivicina TaxID=2978046 RepID=UPI00325FA28D|nr:Putative membrane protein, contains bPH2 domain [Candidatus Nanohalobia archaeon BNXNv]
MKLAKESILYKAVQNVLALLAIFLFSGSTSLQAFNLAAALVIGALFIVTISSSLLWQYLVWKNYSYRIEAEGVQIKHGVVRKNQREIPLRRIQNVDIKRNIVHRMLGIAQVNLETAGGGTTEASFKFVDLDEARNIQQKVRRLKKGESEEEADEEDRELLFELNQKELGVLSATSIQGRAIAGLFGVIGIMGGFLGSQIEGFGLQTAVASFFVLSAGLLVVWVSSAVTQFFRFFDFKLYRADDSLEYERGLINRSEGSIPLEKVQKLTIEENPLKRWLGYSTLKIETAGYSAEQSMEQGPESAIPIAEKSRVIDFAHSIQDFNDLSLGSIPGRARRRYIGRYTILSTVLLGAGVVVDAFYGFNYLVLLALYPISLVAAHFKWINKGYGSGESHFFTMNGFWNRETMIVPYYRIQNLIESQTLLQRRWNLSSLTLDIAGTSPFQKDAVAEDLDTVEARKLREETFDNFKKSLQ